MIAQMAPMMMRIVAGDGDNGTRVGELSAAAAVQCVEQESGSEQRPSRKWARSQLTSFSICLVVLMALSMCRSAQTRYIHATYRFSPANYDDLQPQLAAASNGMEAQPQMSRRQDDESDEADDDDDDPDQRAAASYRSQDDGSGGGGGGGDNYGDNESDGPYEETPADQEGQADLERFFDDHLGASDREGMDKENLPTNLVGLLSEPPQLMNMNRRLSIRLPTVREMASEQLPHKLTAVPLVPVTNPIVRARETSGLESDQYEQLASLPTIQTSFIQLPDEKMLITHKVTARNSPHRPLPRPLNLASDPDNDQRHQTLPTPSGQSDTNQVPNQSKSVNEPSGGLANNLLTGRQSFGLRISPTEALPSMGPAGNLSPVANEIPVASSSGVISTEDDEFDRVYVTNEPDKPFKIDALGGFDPEEDFTDAAKELEVVASDELGRRTPADLTSERSGIKRRSNQEAIVSDESREASGTAPRQGIGGGDELAGANRPDHSGQISSPLQEISFNDPDTDTMYEDASETDEVTFGQDDPYQTDLEAEMRQQEYDKLQSSPARLTNDQLSGRGDNLNVVVDNGDNYRPSGATASAKQQAAASDDNDDDIDSDIDSEYKPDPSSSQQRDSIAPVAAPSMGNRPGRGKQQSDADDEGAWVNDGADEMDIPSQSHQNSVLEKAEQRDEAAAAAARANADEAIDKQTPDGGGAGTAEAEGGQTNDNGEENVRMPNADYLKNDFVEDDSGYAS